MKYLNYKQDSNEIILFPIGDLHYGSEHFNRKVLEKLLEEISKEKNARIILMGDLAETALKDSVGAGVYEQQENAQQQMMSLKSIFYPYREIIDGVITGNHEERIYKNSGFDLSRYFCQLMGIEDKYCRYQGIIRYSIGHRAFYISFWHGAGGGGSAGASLNKLQKQSETIYADIYLMGHVHKKQVHTKDFFIPHSRNNILEKINQYFIVTGSALEYENSYAEMSGMTPSSIGFTRIELSVQEKFYAKEKIHRREKIIRVKI